MCVALGKNKKKKRFLIVDTKGLKREREVPKYAEKEWRMYIKWKNAIFRLYKKCQ